MSVGLYYCMVVTFAWLDCKFLKSINSRTIRSIFPAETFSCYFLNCSLLIEHGRSGLVQGNKNLLL